MKIIVFGDSITQGFWGIEHGWVDRIRVHYAKLQFAKDDYDSVFNLGVDSNNSADVLGRIKAEVLARSRSYHAKKPIVVVQIGVNDCSTGSGDIKVHIDKADYKTNLKRIISEVRDIASAVIFVGFSSCDESRTTPVSWGEYYYTNASLKEYELVMQEVAEAENVEFVPVFDVFKQSVDSGEDLLPDGLHPNDRGHTLIADLILPKLQELLS